MNVVSVEWLGGHRLRLAFDNGDQGEVDLSKYLRFRHALAHHRATGKPLPSWAEPLPDDD